MVRPSGCLIALMLLLLPGTAHAADVSVVAGELRFVAAAGRINNVTFVEQPAGRVTVTRHTGLLDNDAFVAGAGCVPDGATAVICAGVTSAGVTSAVVDLGDQGDRIEAGDPDDPDNGVDTIPLTVHAGEGNDAVVTGPRNDVVDGGSGNDELDGFTGDDQLAGGDGNDRLEPNTGTDSMTGGDGIDIAAYGKRNAPTLTLDGAANDGDPGENDLVASDVEGLEGFADPANQVTLVGDGRANRLTVVGGRGVITAGEGPDVLEGGPQDDTLNARDGSPDTVLCNGGTDTVFADTLDTISTTCEILQVQAMPGGPFDDHPPAVSWASPIAGASLTANDATTLEVNASDDRGLSRVQFFDDDRLVCEDGSAPYTCAYRPRGGDVGRNTLIAVGIDSANQATSAIRPVEVRRFTAPALTLSLRPSRDRRRPYKFQARGRLSRPTSVSPSQGCSGTIAVTAKRRSRTVETQRVALSRTCEYRANFTFRTRAARRLRMQARFAGNEILSAKSSRARTARLG
jgi:hypothetical protein